MPSELTQDSSSNDITIEVIYALPTEQNIISIQIRRTCDVKEAILKSGILEKYPEINLDDAKLGIFSKKCKLTDSLHNWDRIEIYRPLIIDPKQARKNRAEKNR